MEITLRYFPEKSKKKRRNDGQVRLYLYISTQAERFKVTANTLVNLLQWDQRAQQIKGNTPAINQQNKYLRDLKQEVEMVYLTERNNITIPNHGSVQRPYITAEWLKKKLSFINKYTTFKIIDGKRVPVVVHKDINFFDAFDMFITDLKGRKKSSGTIKNFDCLKVRLTELNENYGVDFNTINEDFLKAFINYFADNEYTSSYTMKNLILLRTFLIWATDNEYNKNNFYTKRKWKDTVKSMLTLPSKKANIVYLTVEEIEKLRKLKLSDQYMDLIKDSFLFSCFSGLRISDIEVLKKSDVRNGTIDIITAKDKVDYSKKLNKMALGILDKYKGKPGELYLPVNQSSINDKLRDIIKMARIDSEVMVTESKTGQKPRKYPKKKYEVLSFHDGRVTYNTINERELRLPEILCKELVGHSTGNEAHVRYRGEDERLIKEANAMFDALFIHEMKVA